MITPPPFLSRVVMHNIPAEIHKNRGQDGSESDFTTHSRSQATSSSTHPHTRTRWNLAQSKFRPSHSILTRLRDGCNRSIAFRRLALLRTDISTVHIHVLEADCRNERHAAYPSNGCRARHGGWRTYDLSRHANWNLQWPLTSMSRWFLWSDRGEPESGSATR